MNFCVISPIAGLEQYARQSKTHLVLAQMLHNDRYREFYDNRKSAGDFIILDNGAYENTKPLDNAAYFNWIKNTGPNVAVLPDHLMSPWRYTTAKSLKFLDEFADQLQHLGYRTQWMFVPQTKKEERTEWVTAMNAVLNDGRVGHYVTWIGLGRYLATEFGVQTSDPNWTHRCYVAEQVRIMFPHIKVHALGMAAGNIGELKYLKDKGVQSIDSSCAVWRGWNGYNLSNQEAWKVNGTPCDFGAPMPTGRIPGELIQSNLEVIFDALR